MATTWTPIASVVQTTIPNDITGNSLSLAPVSGDSTAVAIRLGNGSSTLYSVDASGNAKAASSAIAGNESVGGNLNVTGTLVANGLTNTGLGVAAGLQSSIAGTASSPAISFTAQTDSGLYLATTSTSAAVLGFAVNGTQALALSKSGISVPGTLSVTGASTLGQTSIGALTAASLGISGNETVSGTLNVSGVTTLAALNAQSTSVSGNASIGGTETVGGLFSANGGISTSLIKTTQTPTAQTINSATYNVSNVQFPGSFGDGNSYPLSGITSDSLGNLALNYQGVPGIRMANGGYNSSVGNAPTSAYTTQFLSGAYTYNVAGNTQLAIGSSAVKFGFTQNTLPVTMQSLSGNILQLQNGGSAPNYTTQTVGTVDYSGNATFAGVIKGTSVTFGDGTSQTTAYTSSAAANQSKFTATSSGTTSSPAFTYTGNTDTGEYLKTTGSSAVLGLSVNATDALTLSKSGVSVPGTLSVTGASTVAALTASNVTLGSSGKLTFGDGTSLSTANASAASYIANSNGTVSAPSFAFTNNTDTGLYLNTSSTSAAVVALTANATNVLTGTKTGVTVAGTLTQTGAATFNAATTVNALLTANNLTLASSGKLTFGDGTTQTTAGSAGAAATFTSSASNGGSASSPAFLSTQSSNTGMYFDNGPDINFTVNGTRVLSLAAAINVPSNANLNVASTTTFNGNVSFNGGASSLSFGNSAITTTGAVSGQTIVANLSASNSTASAPAFNFGSSNSSNSGFYYPSSSVGVACTSAGTLAWNASSSAMTLALPTTLSSTVSVAGAATLKSTTSAAGTITSTTAAGTASFVSTQGFKNKLDMGHVFQTNTTTSAASCVRTVILSSGSGPTASIVYQTQDFAGSVIGIAVNNSGAIATTTLVQLYKNGSAVSGATCTVASNGQFTSATFAKGTYTFAANDYLQAFVTYGATGYSLATSVTLTTELGA